MNPRAADAIRKACAYTLAIAITLLTFRVLSRVAEGLERLADVELWLLVVLGTLALLWVSAAKRVRRPPPESGEAPDASRHL